MPKKKRGIRGKKGEQNLGTPQRVEIDWKNPYAPPPEEPRETNINVFATLKKDKGIFGDFAKKLILTAVVVTALFFFLFVFTDWGPLLVTNGGIYFQKAIAIVSTTAGGIRTTLTNPGETFGSWDNPDATRLGSEERGVFISSFKAPRNYEQGQQADLQGQVLIKNLKDNQPIPLKVSCYTKYTPSGTTEPEITAGLVTIPLFLKSEPLETQEILIEPEKLTILKNGGEFQFGVHCIIPKEASDSVVYTGDNTLITREAILRIDYTAKTQSILKVVTSPSPYSKDQLDNLALSLRNQGIVSRDGKLGAQTSGGPLDLQVDLGIAQPITPGSFPTEGIQTIPLTVGLTDSQGWAGQLTSIYNIEILGLPNMLRIGQGCRDFERGSGVVGGGPALKQEIIQEVNDCIKELQDDSRAQCAYDPRRLREAFSCELELETLGETPNVQDIVVEADYDYSISQKGGINYQKPRESSTP